MENDGHEKTAKDHKETVNVTYTIVPENNKFVGMEYA